MQDCMQLYKQYFATWEAREPQAKHYKNSRPYSDTLVYTIASPLPCLSSLPEFLPFSFDDSCRQISVPVHSTEHVLTVYCVTGSVLGIEDTTVGKPRSLLDGRALTSAVSGL